MSDIFISYSRADSEQALQLAEKLRAAGVGVWIDQHGIDGASQWATEIAEGIRGCSTFLLLISAHSIASESVLKELSLAADKRKRILPVELLATELPASFEYALAGLQRVAIEDFDAILRAHMHGISRIAIKDHRKSLIVLPFEDLSPEQDNGWFADGLVSEMIDSLANIKSLRLIDRKTSMDLKGFRGKTHEIADALQVRYFIQGSVRKFGEQIKISVSLLDIDSSDYLWQDSHRGEFKDIFDIQEAVANKVVLGLKLHLTKDEEAKVKKHGTENAEAYELFAKGGEFFHRQTREGFQHSIQLSNDAIALDPQFAKAYQLKANALAGMYRTYDRDPKLLVEAERLVQEALKLQPDYWEVLLPLTLIYQLQGKLEDAERVALEYIEKAPDSYLSHFGLGFFYMNTGQYVKAIPAYEKAIELKPDDMASLNNIVSVCSASQNKEKTKYWAERVLPYVERHLRLRPDDDNARVNCALLLAFAGRHEEAREAALRLENVKDGKSLFNTACIWALLGDHEQALKVFRTAIEAGYRNIRLIRTFLLENADTFSQRPEYKELELLVKQVSESVGHPASQI